MQKMFTPDPNTKGISWVMVDSDGEEVGEWLFTGLDKQKIQRKSVIIETVLLSTHNICFG